MTTEVHSLKTAQTVAVYSLPPKEAVVAAFRQLELKNFNWWQEDARVPPIKEGESFYFCGHFAARKDAKSRSEREDPLHQLEG